MSIWDYIAAKAVPLCLATMAGLYLMLVCYFCALPFSLTLILLLSGVIVLLLCVIVGWRRADRRLRMLRSRLDVLPEKYLIGETLERPRDAVELEYYLLMKEISRSAIGAAEQTRAEKQDYCDYVERWVHEIKTPLTACSLILANGGDTAKLRRELRRADNLTDTILTYAKLRTAEKDTQITLAGLRAVCDQAIREEYRLWSNANAGTLIIGALYVSTVFVCMALAILSVKTLSTLEEERRRFAVLYRLGADVRMQKSALLRQIGVFFLMPFAFPLLMTVPIGVIFGKVYEIWDFQGLSGQKAMETAVLIALVIACVYAMYFLITYHIACDHVILKPD